MSQIERPKDDFGVQEEPPKVKLAQPEVTKGMIDKWIIKQRLLNEIARINRPRSNLRNTPPVQVIETPKPKEKSFFWSMINGFFYSMIIYNLLKWIF